MQELRQLIHDKLEDFPDFDDFYVQIDLILQIDTTPDTKLDAAKSLLEGVVKTMLHRLDTSLSQKQLAGMKTKNACKRLFDEISRQTKDFDTDFINSLISLVHATDSVRNKRGDMSHGHVAPKNNSRPEFVDLVIAYVSASCVYLLKYFHTLDFSYQTPVKYDSDENAEFNEYLDTSRDPIGNVPYSKALYDLDYDAYIDEQDRFNN